MEWVHCHIARQPVSPCERMPNIPRPGIGHHYEAACKECRRTLPNRHRRWKSIFGAVWLSGSRTVASSRSRWARHDSSDRLLIPEKLYGQRTRSRCLLASFDRVVTGGRPELVLVSGYSGIGKSAIVNELHKPLVPPRGLFASGKFDQYKRDIPYATLAQAFQSLIRTLLSKGEEELAKWRDAIREAIEPNGLLIVDLVPELKHIIGEQPPSP